LSGYFGKFYNDSNKTTPKKGAKGKKKKKAKKSKSPEKTAPPSYYSFQLLTFGWRQHSSKLRQLIPAWDANGYGKKAVTGTRAETIKLFE